MSEFDDLALQRHQQLAGKIEIALKDDLGSRDKLSTYYTPGVAAVSRRTAAGADVAREYTWLKNNLAVISDGSAVLGLGDIGPYGALPVMEGKAMLFKHFANIDAVPIVLDVHSADEIVAAAKAMAPSFSAINLEDIAAPICFEVEERLKAELPIPVMHDDQHGTAVVTLAGLINACKVTARQLNESTIVISGAGAAGVAIAKLINLYAPGATLIAVDSKGVIDCGRTDLNESKQRLLAVTGTKPMSGGLAEAVRGADIFIGVSAPGVLTADMVGTMAKDPIIFAMANPDPEIMPDVAERAGAAVVATGRSDFPNQVNNALAFPGIFRGALDNGVQTITDQHKIAAAEALAGMVKQPSSEQIIPSINQPGIVEAVATVIR